MFEIKCTDKRHLARQFHGDSEVRAGWNSGVLASSSIKRPVGEYAEVCSGCGLANQIDDVPELRTSMTIEERVKALESR